MRTKLLFVCQSNVNRSPTFARVVKENYPTLQVKSAGVWHSGEYGKLVDSLLIDWADVIYVMDWEQVMALSDRFGPEIKNKIKIIGISDQYYRDEPRLVEIIYAWMDKEAIFWDT